MSTGIAILDTQHQALTESLTQLETAILEARGQSEALRLLRAVGPFAAEHFQLEEQWMTRLSCPALAKNREAHEEFMTRYRSICNEVSEYSMTTRTMVNFSSALSRWIETHIVECDIPLMNYLNDVPVADRVAGLKNPPRFDFHAQPAMG